MMDRPCREGSGEIQWRESEYPDTESWIPLDHVVRGKIKMERPLRAKGFFLLMFFRAEYYRDVWVRVGETRLRYPSLMPSKQTR